MEILKIAKQNLSPSLWDGGKTFEYFIFPTNSLYKDRDFIFRISSATIEKCPSKFTQFKGYQRYLLMLDNDLKIIRNDKDEYYSKNEIFKFSSNDEITSFSLGTDFNLMVKEEMAEIELINGDIDLRTTIKYGFIYSCSNGEVFIDGKSEAISKDDCIVFTSDIQTHIQIQGKGDFISAFWD